MSFTLKCLELFRFSKSFIHLFCLVFLLLIFFTTNVLRINWPPLSWVVLKIDPHNTYIKKNWPPLKFSNDPMSVNLDKRPILNTFYRQKVWENKVTIPAHKQNFFNAFVSKVLLMLWREKWNMFGRIQPTFDYHDTFLSQECKNG